ncbi:hypothetical protein X773_33175 [Mesorhizobium sp. LSJC285A00]|nr:hypothetical protein X773_33175 [Mesorhizobium sp. LSJC285A00]
MTATTSSQCMLQAFIMGPDKIDPGPACLGQPNAMDVAVKQLHVEQLLESYDVAADTGFPHSENSCSLPEAAMVDSCEDMVQTAERVVDLSQG